MLDSHLYHLTSSREAPYRAERIAELIESTPRRSADAIATRAAGLEDRLQWMPPGQPMTITA